MWEYHANDSSETFFQYLLSWNGLKYALRTVCSVLLEMVPLLSTNCLSFIHLKYSHFSIASTTQSLINVLQENYSYLTCLLVPTISTVYLSFFASLVNDATFSCVEGFSWGLFCERQGVVLLFVIFIFSNEGQTKLKLKVEDSEHFPAVWSSLSFPSSSPKITFYM